MSSKKISMDYQDYLKDIKKATSDGFIEGFELATKDLLDDLVYFAKNKEELLSKIKDIEKSNYEEDMKLLKVLKALQKIN